jgi:hypothetical protein
MPFAAAFPGAGAGAGDPAALAACIDRQVECRTCQNFDASTGAHAFAPLVPVSRR